MWRYAVVLIVVAMFIYLVQTFVHLSWSWPFIVDKEERFGSVAIGGLISILMSIAINIEYPSRCH